MDTQFPQIPKSPKVHNPANQQIKKCAEKSSRKEEMCKSSVIHNLNPQDIHTINQYIYVYTTNYDIPIYINILRINKRRRAIF